MLLCDIISWYTIIHFSLLYYTGALAVVGAVGGDELRHDRHGLRAVHLRVIICIMIIMIIIINIIINISIIIISSSSSSIIIIIDYLGSMLEGMRKVALPGPQNFVCI